jgi:hypothetical protein
VKRKFYLKPASGAKFLILLSVFFLFYCSQKSGGEKEKLAHLYIDLLTVEEFYHGIPDTIRAHQEKLFAKYQISSAQFTEKIKRFKEDKEEWDEFFKLAESYLKELNDKVKK